MRKKTNELREQGWKVLGRKGELNAFKSREEYDEAFLALGEVRLDGSNTYLTRKNHNEPFSPHNLVLVFIESPEDCEKVCKHAVCIGGEQW